MSLDDCFAVIQKLTRNGNRELFKHKKAYDEVLLHIFASKQIERRLFDLLQKKSNSIYVNIYSKAIEMMWCYGDESVKNVVDVSLLEQLRQRGCSFVNAKVKLLR